MIEAPSPVTVCVLSFTPATLLVCVLYFANSKSLFLLKLDLSQRAEGLVYEAPSAGSGRGGLFPHWYAPLGIDQIVKVWEIKRGAFMLPEEVILEAEKH